MNSLSTINRQTLVGTLDADAESRAMPSGESVINLKVVTYDQFKDRTSGETREIAEFHRVAIFGQLAETARDLKKGTVVCVEGRSKTRKYKVGDQDRYITELVVSGFTGRCVSLGRDEVSQQRPNAAPPRASTPAASSLGAPAQATDVGPSDDGAPF